MIFGDQPMFGGNLTFVQKVLRGYIVYYGAKFVWKYFKLPIIIGLVALAAVFAFGYAKGVVGLYSHGLTNGMNAIPAESIEFSASAPEGAGNWSVTNHSDTYAMSMLEITCHDYAMDKEVVFLGDVYVKPGESASGSFYDTFISPECKLTGFKTHQ